MLLYMYLINIQFYMWVFRISGIIQMNPLITMVIIIHHLLKHEIIMHSVHTGFMCSYDFENKQQLFIYTALTNQSLYSQLQF